MPNAYVNKVVYGSQTLVDLTADTVTAENVIEGYTFHAANGNTVEGTLTHITNAEIDEITAGSGGSGGGGGGNVTVEPLSVIENGIYRAPTGSAYSPVTVNVSTATPSLQSKTTTPTTSQQTVTPDNGCDGLSSVIVNAIPSEYIIPSGSETKTANGTYDVSALAQLVVNVASPVKTATGTFTGNGTRTIDVTCAFEPDIVYFTSDPGTTASSGTVAVIIVRDLMTATRYRNNATTNSHYAIPDITDLNTNGSSYSWRATYDSTNSKVTLYCFSNNARALLTNGRTYTYTFIRWT